MPSKYEPFAIDAPNDPSYLGFTKQISPAPADKSWGTLFEGLGQLGAQTIKAVDTVNENKINDALREGVDKTQEPYTNLSDSEAAQLTQMKIKGPGAVNAPEPGSGIRAAPGVAPGLSLGINSELDTPGAAEGTQAPPPIQVRQEMDRMGQLTEGYHAGTVGQTYLQNQYLATSKALKTQYPGYKDYVDQRMHALTGNIPANALIQSIFADFKASSAAKDQDANRWASDVKSWMKYLGADGTNQAMSAYGDAQKMANIRAFVAGQEQSEHMVTTAKQTLELKKANREDTVQDTTDVLRMDSNQLASRIISGATFGAGGMDMNGFQQKMAQYVKAGNISPDELNAFKATVKDISDRASLAYDEMARQNTYTKVPASVVQAEKAQFMSGFKLLEDKIANKDFGTAAVTAQTLAQMKNASGVDIMQKSDIIRKLAGMDSALGQGSAQLISGLIMDNANKVIGPDGKPVTAMAQLWQDLSRDNTVKRAYGEGSLNDITKVPTGQKPPANYLSGEINNIKQMIASPDAPIQMRLNAAKHLSQPGSTDFVMQFKGSEKSRVLAMLTSPEVTKGMSDMRATDPQAWENYKSWATQTLVASSKAQEGTLRDILGSPSLNARWNTKTHQIDYDDPSLQKQPLISGGKPASVPFPEIDRVLKPYNATLKTIQGIYSQDKENITEKLLPVLGLPFKALEKPKGESKEGTVTDLPAIMRKPTTELPSGVMPFSGDSGPKVNAARVSQEWGNPLDPNFAQDHLQNIKAGGKDVPVNKYAHAAFQGFVSELEGMGYKIKDVGGHSLRAKKWNPGDISQHAFGNAIDINPSENTASDPMGKGAKTNLPPNVSEIAAKYGLSWGGNWKSRKDYMHFEYGGK